MARRFVPVLLAARMNYRLDELQAALAKGDSAKAQKDLDALRAQWLQFAHIARERSETLCADIQRSLDAVTEAAPTAEAMAGRLGALTDLLKQLAA